MLHSPPSSRSSKLYFNNSRLRRTRWFHLPPQTVTQFVEITCGLFRFPEYVDNMSDKDKKFAKPKYGPLPVVGLPVQVQCIGFKCMAFRDQAGRWVDLFTREFLPTVLGVVPGC